MKTLGLKTDEAIMQTQMAEILVANYSGNTNTEFINSFENQIVENDSSKTKEQLSNKLFENYPNPFNPTTSIKYQISKDGKVKLSIYDILGRLVKELVNEVQTAGVHSANFNASELSSGVYFYNLTTPDFNSIKKMLLLK